MERTWEGMLTELEYDKAQRNKIVARIEEFDRIEDTERQKLYRDFPMISDFVKCKTLENLNSLLDCSNLNLRITNASCSVLILADRLYGLGIGVEYYLKKCTMHSVLGVACDLESVMALVEENRVDVLIIAGLQSNNRNYSAVEFLRRRFSTIPVMWAGLDYSVRMVCKEYGVFAAFDRHRGLDLLAEFITELSPYIPRPHPPFGSLKDE